MEYQALVVEETIAGSYEASIKTLNTEDLPAGELLVKVRYSSVNYKDALSYSGNKGVTQVFPHTPGIDASGEIVESSNANFEVGSKVILTGYDLGMNTFGGFGEYVRVPSDWAIKLPSAMLEQDAMAWGTAGLTAALCVDKLLTANVSKKHPIIVSGSTGGVGSIAIRLLTKLGFKVHALTSKPEQEGFLKGLGVDKMILLSDFIDDSKRPLLKPLYSGAIDVAGGDVLASILKVLDYGGSVACCGLVASPKLNTSVFPFILRDISLLGVDSVELPLSRKQEIWDKIATEWSLSDLTETCQLIKKEQLTDVMDKMVAGKISGRYILSH